MPQMCSNPAWPLTVTDVTLLSPGRRSFEGGMTGNQGGKASPPLDSYVYARYFSIKIMGVMLDQMDILYIDATEAEASVKGVVD